MRHRCWSRRIDEQEWYLHSPLREREQQTRMRLSSSQRGWDMLGSSQVAIRSDGEPAVMQVAAAVRDARRAGSVTTLETSAPGDHAGNGLAERAVGLVGGMVRTLKNELEFPTVKCKYHQNRKPLLG